MNVGWINTYSGVRFDLFDPQPEHISIVDIAHALSQICRFTGHTAVPYSVAQHSVYVSDYCAHHLSLDGLMHDATEAYLNDLARPLKKSQALAPYRAVEMYLQQVIAKKYGLTFPEPEHIKDVDLRVAATEAHQLLPNLHPDWYYNDTIKGLVIEPWSAQEAECRFYRRFLELTHG